MRVDLFDYKLPADRIAQEPLPERSASRMMVLDRATGLHAHSRFRDLPGHLRRGDCLVLNDTMVLPARLYGRRGTGGRVEVLLLRPTAGDRQWHALARPARRLRRGDRVEFGPGLAATVVGEGEEGLRELRFDVEGDFGQALDRLGQPPLPPYIRRRARLEDRQRYQTVYAQRAGAVAAPTAGLHFDQTVLAALAGAGVETVFLTLHVGLGTFRPVTTENAEDHHMHAEAYQVLPEAAERINQARAAGGRIVAVGTTVVRALETLADEHGRVRPGSGETDLFIYPGHQFRAVEALLTNFHLPRSTLLMMVAAFAGREAILAAYQEAIDTGYRFYSYGDCMLIV